MGLLYGIDPTQGHVRISGTGALKMAEMIAAVEQVAEDPRFCPQFTVILDLRNADYAAELKDGNAFVGVLKRRQSDFLNRFALLVPESLHFLAQLYCVLADTGGFDRMQCFRSIDAAEEWCKASQQRPQG